MYHRRLHTRRLRSHRTRIDTVLFALFVLSAAWTLRPLASDLISQHRAQTVISRMTSVSDNTRDKQRMQILRAAQAYNLRLGGAGSYCDNEGMRGGNEGSDDILMLAQDGDVVEVPYAEQLGDEPDEAFCWIEVPAAAISQPVYHDTKEETLAQGVGHLASTSLPVGGTSSHCVLTAHSGMEHSHMFDHLDEMNVGDLIILHVLGDAYWYEVYQKEVLLPAAAEARCQIVEGQDLCTLITCTPYGTNTHRLLVHARRVPAQSQRPKDRSIARYVSDRRVYPPLSLTCVVGLSLVVSSIHRAKRRRLERQIARGLSCAIGMALCLVGLALMANQLFGQRAYDELTESATKTAHEKEEGIAMLGFEVDWKMLRTINPDVAAWVEVVGTDISLPVIEPHDGDMTYYLTHDLWSRKSVLGTPFLDHRCHATGTHRLVYGHHLALGGQFSQLQHAYQQDCFDTLGYCLWHVPEGQTSALVPLCAATVDQSFADIQQFSFVDHAKLTRWLTRLCEQASARTADWQTRVDDASSVVTLVTCSSDLSNQPWRTIVVFVAAETPP